MSRNELVFSDKVIVEFLGEISDIKNKVSLIKNYTDGMFSDKSAKILSRSMDTIINKANLLYAKSQEPVSASGYKLLSKLIAGLNSDYNEFILSLRETQSLENINERKNWFSPLQIKNLDLLNKLTDEYYKKLKKIENSELVSVERQALLKAKTALETANRNSKTAANRVESYLKNISNYKVNTGRSAAVLLALAEYDLDIGKRKTNLLDEINKLLTENSKINHTRKNLRPAGAELQVSENKAKISEYQQQLNELEKIIVDPELPKLIAEYNQKLKDSALSDKDIQEIKSDYLSKDEVGKKEALALANTNYKFNTNSIREDTPKLIKALDSLTDANNLVTKAESDLKVATENYTNKLNEVSKILYDNLVNELSDKNYKIDNTATTQEQRDAAILGVLLNVIDAASKDLSQKVQSILNILESLSLVEDTLATVGDPTGNFTSMSNKVKASAEAFKEENEQIKNVNSITTRASAYVGLAGTIQTLRRALTSAMSTIKELDALMTEMAVVTDQSVSDYWDQLPTYTARANELGLSIKSVYEASTLYYQQGLKTNDVTAVANQTLKMARIAGLDAADATDKMTAALRGFNMEVNESNAENVADVYSKLAAITASDVEEISTAMTKTASLASNAGMEFETTAAFLSQIIETTRESAETAGTAMKTVIARFEELKKDPSEIGEVDGEVVDANLIETALKSVGVQLRDSAGLFRDLDDVFLELAKKWDSLDTNTQRYVATLAAGSRQQSRFIAMMQDYDRTIELVNAANTAAGASTEQYNKTLESLETKLNLLQNAWDSFTMSLMNSDVLKTGVDLLTNFVTGINNLTDAFGGAIGSITKFALVAGTLALANKAITGFNTEFSQSRNILKSVGAGFSAMIPTTNLQSSSIQLLTSRLSGFNTVTKEMVLNINKVTSAEVRNTVAETVANAQKKNLVLSESEIGKMYGLTGDLLDDYVALVNIGVTRDTAATVAITDKTKALLELAAALQLTDKEYNNYIKENSDAFAKGAMFKVNSSSGITALTEKLKNLKSTDYFSKLKTELSGLWTEVKLLLPAIGQIAAGIAIFAVALAGLLAIIKVIHRNSPAGQLEGANEALTEALLAADNASDSYNNLKDSLDNLSSNYESLENLTRGTQEWNEAVTEINSSVLDLLDSYSELAQYVTVLNGVMTISDQGMEAVQAQKLQEMQNALVASAGASLYLILAQIASDYTDLSDLAKLGENLGRLNAVRAVNDAGLALAGAGTAAGASIGGGIGAAFGGIGAAPGATAGAVIGAIGGALTGSITTIASGAAADIAESTELEFLETTDTIAKQMYSGEILTVEDISEALDTATLPVGTSAKEIAKEFYSVSDELKEYGELLTIYQNKLEAYYLTIASNALNSIDTTGWSDTSEQALSVLLNSDYISKMINDTVDSTNERSKSTRKEMMKYLAENTDLYIYDNGALYNKNEDNSKGDKVDFSWESLETQYAAIKAEADASEKFTDNLPHLIAAIDNGNEENAILLRSLQEENGGALTQSDINSMTSYSSKVRYEWLYGNSSELKEIYSSFDLFYNTIMDFANTLQNNFDDARETFGIIFENTEKFTDYFGDTLTGSQAKTLTTSMKTYFESYGRNSAEELLNLIYNGIHSTFNNDEILSLLIAAFGSISDWADADAITSAIELVIKLTNANKSDTQALEQLRRSIIVTTGAIYELDLDDLTDTTNELNEAFEELVNNSYAISEDSYNNLSDELKRQFVKQGENYIYTGGTANSGKALVQEAEGMTFKTALTNLLSILSNRKNNAGEITTASTSVAEAREKKAVAAAALLIAEQIASPITDAINNPELRLNSQEFLDYKDWARGMEYTNLLAEYDSSILDKYTGKADALFKYNKASEEYDYAIKLLQKALDTRNTYKSELFSDTSEYAKALNTIMQDSGSALSVAALADVMDQLQEAKALVELETTSTTTLNNNKNTAKTDIATTETTYLNILIARALMNGLIQEAAKYQNDLNNGVDHEESELTLINALIDKEAESKITNLFTNIEGYLLDIEDYGADSPIVEDALSSIAYNQFGFEDAAEGITFVAKNLDTLLKAMEGDTDAWISLQEAFANELELKVEDGAISLESLQKLFTEAGDNINDVVNDLLQSGLFEIQELVAEENTQAMVIDYTNNVAKVSQSVAVKQGETYKTIVATDSKFALLAAKEAGTLAALEDVWENPYTWLDNMNELIDALANMLERLENTYDRLISKSNKWNATSANNLSKNVQDLISNLILTADYYSDSYSKALQDITGLNENYNQYTNYWSYDKESGAVMVDYMKMNKDGSLDTDTGETFENLIDKVEELSSTATDSLSELLDIYDQAEELQEKGTDEYKSLFEDIKTALINILLKNIDELSSVNDSITSALQSIVDGIQEAVDEERQIRLNQETEKNISDKLARLQYLMQDTSGGNQVEIMSLLKEINEAQQDYTDSLVDQAISDLTDANEKAAELRLLLIDIALAQLDIYTDTGKVWTDAEQIIQSSLSAIEQGTDPLNTKMGELLLQDAGVLFMNAVESSEWEKTFTENSAEALFYKGSGTNTAAQLLLDVANLWDTIYNSPLFNTTTGKVGNALTGTTDYTNLTNVTSTLIGSINTLNKTIQDLISKYNNSNIFSATDTYQGVTRSISLSSYNNLELETDGTDQYVKFNDYWYKTSDLQKNASGNYYLIKAGTTRYTKYATGGLSTSTGPAWLDGTPTQPELVLNAEDTRNFIDLTNILRKTSQSEGGITNSGDTNVEVNIAVDSLGNDYDVEQLANAVTQYIAKETSTKNNNIVTRAR